MSSIAAKKQRPKEYAARDLTAIFAYRYTNPKRMAELMPAIPMAISISSSMSAWTEGRPFGV